MQVRVVETKRDRRRFHRLASFIYADDPFWIQPLTKDVENVFDAGRNKAHRHGEVRRWIVTNKEGLVVGRVAAFVNRKYTNKGDDMSVGGIGFFESINDQKIANLLFDTAKEWLQSKKMDAMDGPINFGERIQFWGLLIDGFYPPLYGLNYHRLYYRELFENYGFYLFYRQFCYGLDIQHQFSNKFKLQYEKWSQDSDISIVHFRKKDMSKFADGFATVYNRAWKQHDGMKKISSRQALLMFRKIKFMIDEKLCWFVYHKENPIAFWINLPEVNDYFKYLKGRLGWWEKLKLLWMCYTKKIYRITGLVLGVDPQWQGKGIDQYMIYAACSVFSKMHYKEYELQWVGEFNPKMINVIQSLEGRKKRVLATYRYLFDRDKPFKPHPVI